LSGDRAPGGRPTGHRECGDSATATAALPLTALPDGDYQISVTGFSMQPTLRDGDVLTVRVPAGRLLFGDVLLIRQGETHFVHRLAGRSAGKLRTKGDGRGHFDGWLSDPSEVEGRVLEVRGNGRRRGLATGRAKAVGLAAGAWSGLCGHAYRVALRLDSVFGRGPGTGSRRAATAVNRAGFALIEAISAWLMDFPLDEA
jgi:hypothetical protein